MIEKEKYLEKKLNRNVEALGGLSIKLLSTYFTGLPDRMCLLPGGRIFFAEIKTTGKKPRAMQKLIHAKLRKLGFIVEVLDTSEKIDKLLKNYERN